MVGQTKNKVNYCVPRSPLVRPNGFLVSLYICFTCSSNHYHKRKVQLNFSPSSTGCSDLLSPARSNCVDARKSERLTDRVSEPNERQKRGCLLFLPAGKLSAWFFFPSLNGVNTQTTTRGRKNCAKTELQWL